MGSSVVSLMNGFGFLVGLAVMALTVYMATLARRAEFGTLKAIGARNGHLYRTVLAQAYISVGLGLVTALAVALALGGRGAAAQPGVGTRARVRVPAEGRRSLAHHRRGVGVAADPADRQGSIPRSSFGGRPEDTGPCASTT